MQAQLKACVCIEYFDKRTHALERRRTYKLCLITYEHMRDNILIQEGDIIALNFPVATSNVKLRTGRAANGLLTIQHTTMHMTMLISGADPIMCQQFCYCLEHRCGVSVKTCMRSASSVVGAKQVGHASAHGQLASLATTKEQILHLSKAESNLARGESLPPMTTEQNRVVTLVGGGRNVFFTGSAGSGKSLVLRALKRLLPSSSTFFTASTAAAAVNVEGTTIHSWAGLTAAQVAAFIAGEIDVETLATAIRARKDVFRRWRSTKTLLIDEISMVDGPTFDLLDALARALLVPGIPFGGIQLVVSGDFFQLRPVGKPGQEVQYAFQSNAWKAGISYCVELSTVFRQKDTTFIAMLNEIRWGRCSESTCEALEARWSEKLSTKGGILPTKLYTHRADVEAENEEHLSRLAGASKRFTSVDQISSTSMRAAAMLDACSPAPKDLILKVGAQVMLCKTLDQSKGLVNGARGVVTAFHPLSGYPMVRFQSGAERDITPEVYCAVHNGTMLGSRTQLPLTLSWAMSIHKSQGMTLDAVEIDLSRVFEFGQAYVALSRATSLEAIVLREPFKPECVRAHPDVVRFYQQLARKEKPVPDIVAAGAGFKRAGVACAEPDCKVSPAAKKPAAVTSTERLAYARAPNLTEAQARRKLDFLTEYEGF